MSETFQQALQSGDIARIARFPKSDLHNHALMGCRRADVEAILPDNPFLALNTAGMASTMSTAGSLKPMCRYSGNPGPSKHR